MPVEVGVTVQVVSTTPVAVTVAITFESVDAATVAPDCVDQHGTKTDVPADDRLMSPSWLLVGEPVGKPYCVHGMDTED